jgi:glycine betaine/proline transport system permease protein
MATVPVALARPLARRPTRRTWAIGLLILAAVTYVVLRGQYLLPHDESAPFFQFLNDVRAWVDSNRQGNAALAFLLDYVRGPIASLVVVFQEILTAIGWTGVTAIFGVLGYLFGGWRLTVLVVGGFLLFGALGLWQATIDTLALTLAAVILSIIIGVPLGIVAGRSSRFMGFISPILDVMQIMPTFAYLAPLTLFFLIGPASAVIATLIYALPPAIRITAYGIRGVAEPTVEAAMSMGSTKLQILRKVQIPMARKQIVLAVNQTMMMALSMVVITALIDAPGLGKNITRSLETLNVGTAFDAGIAIVVLAIVLDRLTTQASEATERRHRSGVQESARRRRTIIFACAAVALAAVAVGALTSVGQEFPEVVSFSFADPINAVSDWIKTNAYAYTNALKDIVSYGLINPMESLLTTAPWWLLLVVIFGVALLISGLRAAIIATVCLLLIAMLGLWEHSMQTLVTVVVATVLTMVIGIALGILAANNDRVSTAMRPFLDAAQTMPAFVYLLPALALFSPSRFTAIVAALIFAVPPVIRLVENGIRNVPATVVEAATAAGSDRRQLIWKVQLPVARESLLLASNQGIVLVLSMVVVGGLVGAGALGFDVVAGFSQRSDFGKGLAAGIAIVLLGIMLDRITQGAGRQRRDPVPDEA